MLSGFNGLLQINVLANYTMRFVKYNEIYFKIFPNIILCSEVIIFLSENRPIIIFHHKSPINDFLNPAENTYILIRLEQDSNPVHLY